MAFTRSKVLVLIDGCFWHGCPEHYRPAVGARAGFWSSKIAENRRRDVDSQAAFEAAGWRVLRFWEHDDVDRVVQAVVAALGEPMAPR
jgi:DNA mismatch endonuclease (patch repair protein)